MSQEHLQAVRLNPFKLKGLAPDEIDAQTAVAACMNGVHAFSLLPCSMQPVVQAACQLLNAIAHGAEGDPRNQPAVAAYLKAGAGQEDRWVQLVKLGSIEAGAEVAKRVVESRRLLSYFAPALVHGTTAELEALEASATPATPTEEVVSRVQSALNALTARYFLAGKDEQAKQFRAAAAALSHLERGEA